MFFRKKRQRIITSDPFALMEHLVTSELSSAQRSEALAYVEQASDFYDAASAPRLGSKPLLYYYSFLNLEKVLLLLRGVEIPTAARHGISDPRANIRERFRLEGQNILIQNRAHDHSQLFPEFLIELGGTISSDRTITFLNVVAQIPSVHRTYSQVASAKSQFIPVNRVELVCRDSYAWARIVLTPQSDKEREAIRGWQGMPCSAPVSRVASPNIGEIWFETDQRRARGQGVTPAFAQLAAALRGMQLSTILTGGGYRHYISLADQASFLPPLAAATAAVFYLGSITRYKPADFDKIRAGKYGWLCEELLATLPLQILYVFASEMAGVDVVKPLAVVRGQAGS
ncbi:MAG TPA: YaaC family protein [Candidatus Krumholzibacteria bacterium]|nr:YaaC family protein [Candidatus Krumholzibacteria bacterium]HRY42076.1 YaaC family protein [Candidatus Krumholzibacteria bacterium]